MTVYLIDGSAILHRAYYSYPAMEKEGKPVNAIYGFTDILWTLLDKFRPDASHIGMIFDKGGPTFRHKLYPEYKANRKPKDTDLVAQFEGVREASRAFNLPVVEQAGYEADDIIATYCSDAFSETKIIMSSDKDLMQLIRGSVSMYDPMSNRHIGGMEVEAKFGVPPIQMIDFQALVGDPTDNVPGVPSIGEKTAAKLLQKYGNLENLLACAHEVDKPKTRQAILQNRETAMLSKKLVTLDRNVPLDVPLEDLKVREPRPGLLYSFLEKMNFKLLLSRMEQEAFS